MGIYIKQGIGPDTIQDLLFSQQNVHIERATQRRVAEVWDVRGVGEHEQVRDGQIPCLGP